MASPGSGKKATGAVKKLTTAGTATVRKTAAQSAKALTGTKSKIRIIKKKKK